MDIKYYETIHILRAGDKKGEDDGDTPPKDPPS